MKYKIYNQTPSKKQKKYSLFDENKLFNRLIVVNDSNKPKNEWFKNIFWCLWIEKNHLMAINLVDLSILQIKNIFLGLKYNQNTKNNENFNILLDRNIKNKIQHLKMKDINQLSFVDASDYESIFEFLIQNKGKSSATTR